MPFIEKNSSPILANYTSKEKTFPVVINSSGAFIMRACADEIYALDPARGRRASGETYHKLYQDLGSNASSVWNFSARFSVVISPREMFSHATKMPALRQAIFCQYRQFDFFGSLFLGQCL